jgi:hypothetical protein
MKRLVQTGWQELIWLVGRAILPAAGFQPAEKAA